MARFRLGKDKSKDESHVIDEQRLMDGVPVDEVEDDEEDDLEEQEQSDRYHDDLEASLENLIDYFTRVEMQHLNRMERGIISKEAFLHEVVSYLEMQGITGETQQELLDRFKRFLWSYDIIDDLINDKDISDIKILAFDTIRIKVLGKRKTSDVKFRNAKAYTRFVERVAIKNKVNLSDQNAIQNFVDKHSNPNFILRFDVTTPFVNSVSTPYLHIRKVPKEKYTIEGLIKAGMLSQETADYLVNAAANRDGILFTGKGASGKTTLMNVLLDYIPQDKSGLVIQENEELFSTHPDLMFQHTVLNKGEGKINYDLKDLARNGLLADLDYFVIGEIKGGEALYFLNAAYTGHKCWASVHGASSTEALNKLVDYIKYASDYSREDALQMLTHINTVVFLSGFKVQEISEVTGWDDEKKDLIYKRIL